MRRTVAVLAGLILLAAACTSGNHGGTTAPTNGQGKALSEPKAKPAHTKKVTQGRGVTPARAFTGPALRGAFYYPWCAYSCSNPPHFHFATQGGYPPDDHTEGPVATDLFNAGYGNIDFVISSWWGQGHFTDVSLPNVLKASADLAALGVKTPKVAAYYEGEGNSGVTTEPGSPNPSTSQITSDLTYLRTTYVNGANGAQWEKIGGKPVLFVYGDGTDGCSMVDRWHASSEWANWFIVMKVFSGYTTCTNQPSDWHQYAPSSGIDIQAPYAVSVSPGFWRAVDAAPLLARSLVNFRSNIVKMQGYNIDFQLVTTMDEWNEGTGVAPTDEWGMTYLDALHTFSPSTPTTTTTTGGTTTTTSGGTTTTTATGGKVLTVRSNGNGTVTSADSFINCGPGLLACAHTYTTGATTTLTATPASGVTFTGWTGACSGTGGCTVTMNAAQSVTATFTTSGTTFPLKMYSFGAGAGTITSSPAGINCHTPANSGATSGCTASFASGTSVTLHEVPASGSTFSAWSQAGSAVVGDPTSWVVPMVAEQHPAATFTTTGTTTTTIPVTTTTGAGGTNQFCGNTPTGNAIDTVIVVAEENRTWSAVGPSGTATFGTGMPYLHAMQQQCTSFAGMTETEPDPQNSATQYVGAWTGYGNATSPSTHVTNDCAPSSSCSNTLNNVFRSLRNASKGHREYVEGATAGCSSSGNAAKHIPDMYMWDTTDKAACTTEVRPLSEMNWTSPPTGLTFITPTLCNDGHDCANATVDSWLSNSSRLPAVFNSTQYKAGKVLVEIWYDEDRPKPNLFACWACAHNQSIANPTYAGESKLWLTLLGGSTSSLGAISTATDMRPLLGIPNGTSLPAFRAKTASPTSHPSLGDLKAAVEAVPGASNKAAACRKVLDVAGGIDPSSSAQDEYDAIQANASSCTDGTAQAQHVAAMTAAAAHLPSEGNPSPAWPVGAAILGVGLVAGAGVAMRKGSRKRAT